jgi:hypothetical protein
VEEVYERMTSSARRLAKLVRLKAPRAIIDNEMRLMTKAIAVVAGPDRVRRWADEASDGLLDAVSVSPTRRDEPPPAPRE